MSIFDYLMVLLSVVLSLGLVHVLNGLTTLFHNRGRVTWSAVYLLWILEVLILHFDFWQYTWSLHDRTSLALGEVALNFLLVSAIYLAASSLVSISPGQGAIDLRETWQGVRREFLAIYLFYLGLVVVVNLTSFDNWGDMLWVTGLYVLPFILLAAAAFHWPNRHVQWIAIGGVLAMDIGRYLFIAPTIG